ncbi:RNA methyltransferase [bacterium]|nr:RNA methyltransferase [bacterium]
MKNKFYFILHNIRSAYNVGSIFRTADGAGIEKIYLTGYSPAPASGKEAYLTSAQKMLAKTALGAEENVSWEKIKNLNDLMKRLKKDKFQIVALEQDENSVDYKKFKPEFPLALIAGNEVKGLDKRILRKCDKIIEIPMRGKKKSLNVSVATGIAGYEIKSKI